MVIATKIVVININFASFNMDFIIIIMVMVVIMVIKVVAFIKHYYIIINIIMVD